MSALDDLKPCPFCGAKDGLKIHEAIHGTYVECLEGCGAFGPDHHNGGWNMRTDARRETRKGD